LLQYAGGQSLLSEFFIMAIQHLSAIENMLSQMRAVAQAASSAPARSQEVPGGSGGFAAELARSLDRVSTLQNASNAQAKAFQLGAPDISLNDVMIDMQKAGIAFQATVQVRNRLVAAYQEIASMPV
jgi:flagellar hook-basal body complex protein FliE